MAISLEDLGIALLLALLVIAFILFFGKLVDYVIRLYTISFPRIDVERIVISQIATIVRQNLPLATGIALAADSESGRPGAFLRRIARLLAQGVPLSEAFRKAMPNASSLTQSILVAGEKSGRLAAALDLAEENLVEASTRKRHRPGVAIPYLITMATATTLLAAGIMVVIIPKYKEIFKDFGTQLPGLTRSLISASKWTVEGDPPGWVYIFVPGVIALFLYYRPRRGHRPRFMSRIADHVRWYTPFFRRIYVNRDLRSAFQIMRISVGSGMDLAVAARIAADTDVNICLRRNLTEFANLLETGTNFREAARAARLGEVAATALASGQRGNDIDAAFRYAIDYHGAVTGRITAVLNSLAVPVVVFIAASFAGYVVLAMFIPLIALINSVTGPM